MTVIEITSNEHFEQFLQQHSNAKIALNFWASFAPPSIQMNAVFAELSNRHSTTHFLQIDAEQLEDISETFDVNAVPFFVILSGKEVVSRISGANPGELKASLERYCSPSSTTIPPPLESTPVSSSSKKNHTASNNTDSTAREGEGVGKPGDGQQQQGEGEESLDARLKKLVSAAPVMLFMKGTPSAPQCGFSRTLVGLLREESVKYGFFNILADDQVRQGLKEFSDWPTFPQVYVGGEFIGGLDVVREMIENGEMKEVLEEAGVKAEAK